MPRTGPPKRPAPPRPSPAAESAQGSAPRVESSGAAGAAAAGATAVTARSASPIVRASYEDRLISAYVKMSRPQTRAIAAMKAEHVKAMAAMIYANENSQGGFSKLPEDMLKEISRQSLNNKLLAIIPDTFKLQYLIANTPAAELPAALEASPLTFDLDAELALLASLRDHCAGEGVKLEDAQKIFDEEFGTDPLTRFQNLYIAMGYESLAETHQRDYETVSNKTAMHGCIDENFLQAKEQIATRDPESTDTFSLANLQLKMLPKSICNIQTQQSELDLSGNSFVTLPPELGQNHRNIRLRAANAPQFQGRMDIKVALIKSLLESMGREKSYNINAYAWHTYTTQADMDARIAAEQPD